MSLGYGSTARLVAEDDFTAIYEYGNYNLNIPGLENREYLRDGTITIHKAHLVEPEIHEKIKRMPSGKKKLVSKRIRVDVDIYDLLDKGYVEMEYSKFAWKEHYPWHYADHCLVTALFYQYQENGKLPEKYSVNW